MLNNWRITLHNCDFHADYNNNGIPMNVHAYMLTDIISRESWLHGVVISKSVLQAEDEGSTPVVALNFSVFLFPTNIHR